MEFNVCGEMREMTAPSDGVGLWMWHIETWTLYNEDSDIWVCERTFEL